jgi:hypothetical protein
VKVARFNYVNWSDFPIETSSIITAKMMVFRRDVLFAMRPSFLLYQYFWNRGWIHESG